MPRVFSHVKRKCRRPCGGMLCSRPAIRGRDLKYGVGLNHLPSGRFGANAAWLGLNVIAQNLARCSTRLGLGDTLITTDTLRRRYLGVPGRLTRSARRMTLHLPQGLALGRAFQRRPGQPAGRRPGHVTGGHRAPADPSTRRRAKPDEHHDTVISYARLSGPGRPAAAFCGIHPVRRVHGLLAGQPLAIGGFGLSLA